MCSMFSVLQGLNWGRSREQDERMQMKLAEATDHINFMVHIYKIQMEGNRYFLHVNIIHTHGNLDQLLWTQDTLIANLECVVVKFVVAMYSLISLFLHVNYM